MEEPIALVKATLEDILALPETGSYTIDTPSLGWEDKEQAHRITTHLFESPSLSGIQGTKTGESLYTLFWESLKNAIEHGNKLDKTKKIDVHWGLLEHGSGNSVLYLTVRDQGNGFRLSPISQKLACWHKSKAHSWLYGTVDFAYNFGDSALYMAKVIWKSKNKPKILQINEPLASESLGADQYVFGNLCYRKDTLEDKHQPRTQILLYDLHRFNALSNDAKMRLSFDTFQRHRFESKVLQPYMSVYIPSEHAATIFGKMRRSEIEFYESHIPYRPHTNTLFYSPDSNQIATSYGVSFSLLPRVGFLEERFSFMVKRGLKAPPTR